MTIPSVPVEASNVRLFFLRGLSLVVGWELEDERAPEAVHDLRSHHVRLGLHPVEEEHLADVEAEEGPAPRNFDVRSTRSTNNIY